MITMHQYIGTVMSQVPRRNKEESREQRSSNHRNREWFGARPPAAPVHPTPILRNARLIHEPTAPADPKLKARFAELGAETMTMTEFGKFVVDETEKWAKVIRAANIKL